ncbi:flagellar basal body P-ring formation chaperone FlgA [Lysobacter sp.]|uniref:flagellar basal body P-ring formation chaperone FlgA n=1 Tax=Lysobacter sp. TaxID=72226 RepID=UPI002D4042E2|nr:flagellar basal body P-ring formation chaperone FlgA [Lysobacter sp.]HZX75853.1 flagellar basal body P-ring formation chaperone FlgA [Lysobacter sp.]
MHTPIRYLLAALTLWPVLAWGDGFQSPESVRAAAASVLSNGAEVVVAARLRMPACSQPLQAAANGATSVAVRCADSPGWQVYVPVRVRQGDEAQAPAPAAAVAAIPAAPTATVGRRLRPATPLGNPTDAEKPAVLRGDPVTLVSRAGGMEVRVGGRAMGAAAIGGRVSVENTASRRIIRGRLVEAGVVEVNL